MNFFKNLYLYRYMLYNLVVKDLRAKYKGSVLGFLWTFANPLLMLCIYSLVFSYITKSNIENYAMFIFVALLPWNYLANSLLAGSGCIIQNGGLIKKVYFPRAILPISVVLSNAINYCLSLVILIPALLIFKVNISFSVISFPLILIIQTVFIMGLCLILSVVTVYLRDVEHFTGILVTAWFFLTPVLFPVEFLPKAAKQLFLLNPATWIVNNYRNIFFYGKWPVLGSLLVAALLSFGFLMFSIFIFNKLQKRVAEEI